MSDIVFVKTSPLYHESIVGIYNQLPELIEKSYAEQLDFVMSQRFGWSDSWGKYLNKLDGYSAYEIILNAEPLQKQWAKENSCKYSDDSWIIDILVAQLSELKADIWFCNDFSIDNKTRKKIRGLVPSIKLLIGWDGIAYNSTEYFHGCDMVISCLSGSSEYYSSHGFKSYTFHHAFDPDILDCLIYRDHLYNVSFLGSVFLRDGGHRSRLEILSKLISRIDIDCWVSGLIPADRKQFRKEQFKRLKRGKFAEFIDVGRVAARNRGQVFGRDMFQVLADSRMTINTHIDIAGNKAANMRLFEATGVGTCLVTDWKENIGDFFVPDEEVVCFKSTAECVDKVRMLIKDDALRNRIALAGQKRTLESHSFEKRIRSFTKYIEKIGF